MPADSHGERKRSIAVKKNVEGKSLTSYCGRIREAGATAVKIVHPSSVVTAPWVRMKCQFGCGGFGYGHCCPPSTPTAEETRKVLDSYGRAILIHIASPAAPDREKRLQRFLRFLVTVEENLFKDGYYKAFVFLAGPCGLCRQCGKISGDPCRRGDQARPAMEACGIDVFQTARNNGFVIETLQQENETRNNFCLILVD